MLCICICAFRCSERYPFSTESIESLALRSPFLLIAQGLASSIVAVAVVAAGVALVRRPGSHRRHLAPLQTLPGIAQLTGVSLAPLPSSKGLPSIKSETLWSERPQIILCTRRPG